MQRLFLVFNLPLKLKLLYVFFCNILDNIGSEDVLFESDSRIFIETSRKNYKNMVEIMEVYMWDTWKEKKGVEAKI